MNILLSGATGQMGRTILSASKNVNDLKIVAGVSEKCEENFEIPLYDSFENITEDIDFLIDFSTPKILDELLYFALSKNLGAVIATTGYSDSEIKKIEDASEKIPIVFSQNMSIGVNVMAFLVEEMSRMLDGFDIEIVEKHHKYKKDAPSGTAKMLFDAANRGRDDNLKPLLGRSGFYDKRDENEVGISSVRAGNIVGEHSVIFAGDDEILEIKHTANSKMIFANGAIKAVRFLKDKKSGLFDMNDVLEIYSGKN